MKEVSVEEITDLVRTTVKDILSKHRIGEITPEGKEIIKTKIKETLEDLHNKGIIQIVVEKSETSQQ